MQQYPDALFHLEYEIDTLPTNCGIKRVTKDQETFFLMCAFINGNQQEFELRMDSNKGSFVFVGKEVPQELLDSEEQISDAIYMWDNATGGDGGWPEEASN